MANLKQSVSTWLGTPPPEPTAQAQPPVRTSLALEQIVPVLEEVEHASVLDLGCVWQSTVAFFTQLGCKLYTENFFRALHLAQRENGPESPPLTERFLPRILEYPEHSFRAILAWDIFDHLPEELVEPMAARLYGLLEPGGVLLGLFHDAREKPSFTCYRVLNSHLIQLVPGSLPLSVQRVYANRDLVKLFAAFSSSRTFLGRDHLRELLLTK